MDLTHTRHTANPKNRLKLTKRFYTTKKKKRIFHLGKFWRFLCKNANEMLLYATFAGVL